MAEGETSAADRDKDMVERLRQLATTDPTVRRREMRSLLRSVVSAGENR